MRHLTVYHASAAARAIWRRKTRMWSLHSYPHGTLLRSGGDIHTGTLRSGETADRHGSRHYCGQSDSASTGLPCTMPDARRRYRL